MKLKTIIVDDEKPARMILKRYVDQVPFLEEVGEFKGPLDAMEYLAGNPVDLILLDIQMPQLSGLDFIKTLTHQPKIILTTAYRQYAFEGFELDVVDYLLKPIAFDRFIKAANKVKNQLEVAQPAVPANPEEPVLVLKSDKRLIRLHPDEVLYIEGMREYVAYHTETFGRIMVYSTMKQLEEELPAGFFMRVHRSFYVNTQKIGMFKDNSLKIGEANIPVSASYKEAVLKYFNR